MALLGFVGVTLIDESVAAVTVKLVLPLITPDVAVIVTEPVFRALPNPCVPAALLTVAVVSLDDDQVVDAVKSCVDVSV